MGVSSVSRLKYFGGGGYIGLTKFILHESLQKYLDWLVMLCKVLRS